MKRFNGVMVAAACAALAADAYAQTSASCNAKFQTAAGGMEAYWTFNKSADAFFDRYSGFAAVNHGATWTSGSRVGGGAMRFNGVSSYVDISRPSLNVPTWPEFTIAVWFLNDGGGAHDGYGQKIFDKADMYSDFSLAVRGPTGGLFFWCGSPSDPWSGIWDSSYNYRDNLWHQAVIVKSGPHGEVWVDGVLKGSSETLGSPSNSQAFLLGYSLHGDGYQRRYWRGSLDEFAVFDRALSPTEVVDLYATSLLDKDYCVLTGDPPTAAAGPDQSAFLNTIVYLDGTASFDDLTPPEGLMFNWSFVEMPPGSTAAFDDQGSPTPCFTPDLAGNYLVQLIVYDSADQSSTDQVLITATVDEPPTAVAGLDQSIHGASIVYLDAGASFDDNTPLAELDFEWLFLEVPPGSFAAFDDPAAPETFFIADQLGTYVVQLVVRDHLGQASAPDEVVISSTNLAPTADAGADLVSIVGLAVTLNASASSDPEWDPLTYLWTLADKPVGSTAVLLSPTSSSCVLVPDLPGPYSVVLVVNDGFGPSLPDTVVVTAITGAEFVEIVAMEAIDLVEALPTGAVASPGNQAALVNFLTQAIHAVQNGHPAQARQKLESCIDRTDGCVLRGAPDEHGPGRDWILDCEAQQALYDDLVAALNAITD